MTSPKNCRRIAAVVVATVTCALIVICSEGVVFAQQSEFAPPPVVPRNQRQGGSVLEVPAIPGRQMGETENLPRIAPQQGQELTVPSRQLSRQAGYEQVTVTIVDHDGRFGVRFRRTRDQPELQNHPGMVAHVLSALGTGRKCQWPWRSWRVPGSKRRR